MYLSIYYKCPKFSENIESLDIFADKKYLWNMDFHTSYLLTMKRISTNGFVRTDIASPRVVTPRFSLHKVFSGVYFILHDTLNYSPSGLL